MSWGRNAPVKKFKGKFCYQLVNFVHVRMYSSHKLIPIRFNKNENTGNYFIWWRAKVVTRHNEKISPPRQATTTREALFLQAIRNVISDHVNINKPIIDCSYTVRAKTTQSPLLRCTLPLPHPHPFPVLSYKFWIPVTRFQRVSIFCY